MSREAISDATYEEWKDIVVLLYYKHNLSRSTITRLFDGAISEWVLMQCAARYKKENPKDKYVVAKQKTRRKINSFFLSDKPNN